MYSLRCSFDCVDSLKRVLLHLVSVSLKIELVSPASAALWPGARWHQFYGVVSMALPILWLMVVLIAVLLHDLS